MIKQILYSDKAISFNGESIKDIEYLEYYTQNKKEVLETYPDWYLINNELYYFKEMDDLERTINELLGVKLARYFRLPTIEYELGIKDDNKKVGLLSKPFFDQNKKYRNLFDLNNEVDKNNCLNPVLKICKTKNEREKLKLQILRMSIMDFYSHQVDRVAQNISLQLSPSISLGPLYDYSESFDAEEYKLTRKYRYFQNRDWEKKNKYIYENDFLRIEFPSKELEQIFNNDLSIYRYFISILDLDIEKYLKDIEKKYEISIPNKLFNYYLDYDKKQKEFVRKIQ